MISFVIITSHNGFDKKVVKRDKAQILALSSKAFVVQV